VTGNGAAGDRLVKVEAVQAVVDRITSWEDGATEETVREELLRGLAEANVHVPADFVQEVVRRVGGESEHFDVQPLLDNEE
jgi:hypothetical protein